MHTSPVPQSLTQTLSNESSLLSVETNAVIDRRSLSLSLGAFNLERVISDGELDEHEVSKKLHETGGQEHCLVPGRGRYLEAQDSHALGSREVLEPKFFKGRRAFGHYQLALLDIGRDLCSFLSVKEFATAIRDAAEAHEEALGKANIWHRDVSVGNIIISSNGSGLLIDWDLCQVISAASGGTKVGECAIERVGTWQFAAARLVEGGRVQPPHNREDDLESFYPVLNWMAFRYTSHTLDRPSLRYYLQIIFDGAFILDNRVVKGSHFKRGELLVGHAYKMAGFQNPALLRLLDETRKVIAARYGEEHGLYQHLRSTLFQPHEFASLFTDALVNDSRWDTYGAKVNPLVDYWNS